MNEIKLLLRLARRINSPKDLLVFLLTTVAGAVILYLLPDDIFE